MVGLLIGVVAGASMTALAGARRTASSYERLRATTLAHDALVTADDPAALERVTALPGVVAASVGTIYPAFVDLESQFDIGVLGSHDDRLGREVNVGRLLAGRRARADRADEVVVNSIAAEQLQLRPGSRLRLTTLTPEQKEQILNDTFEGPPAGPVLSLHVVGVVRNADDLHGDQASVLVFAGSAFQARYSGSVGRFTDFASVRLREGAAGFDEFARDARREIGTEGETSVTGAHELSETVEDAMRVLTTGLVVLGLGGLLVALVVGPQALGRQLATVTVDQPVLTALGMTRRARTAAGVIAVAPAALVAALTAGAVAVLASPLTPINLGRQAEPDPGVAVDAVVHGLGVAATAVIVLASAVALSWRLARRTDASGDTPARPSSATRLSQALGLGPSAVAGVRMALERGAGRSALPMRSAIVGAVVGAAGLAGVLTFAASLDRLTSQPSRYGTPWDLQPDLYELDAADLEELADASDVGIFHRAAVEVKDGGNATAYAMEPRKGAPTFTVVDGRMPFAPDEAALGPDLRQRLGRTIGETFALRAGDEWRQFRIVGTALSPSLDQDPIAGGVFVTASEIEAVSRSQVTQQAVLRWRPGVDRAAAEGRFKAAFEGALSAYSKPRPPGEVMNLGRAGALPEVFGVFLAAVAVAALLHALVVSARRRRHDLAILRALGFVRPQIGASIAWQATTIAMIGLVIGLPLGVATGRWIWMIVADGIGVADDPLVPVAAGALLVVGSVVVANLLSLPVGLRAARVAPAAVLRAE